MPWVARAVLPPSGREVDRRFAPRRKEPAQLYHYSFLYFQNTKLNHLRVLPQSASLTAPSRREPIYPIRLQHKCRGLHERSEKEQRKMGPLPLCPSLRNALLLCQMRDCSNTQGVLPLLQSSLRRFLSRKRHILSYFIISWPPVTGTA